MATKRTAKPKATGRQVKAASRGKTKAPRSKPAEVVADAGSYRSGSKGEMIVGLLKQARGATITELTDAIGWQAHSVRGFISGTLKKNRGFLIVRVKGEDGQPRYRIAS